VAIITGRLDSKSAQGRGRSRDNTELASSGALLLDFQKRVGMKVHVELVNSAFAVISRSCIKFSITIIKEPEDRSKVISAVHPY